MLLVRIVANAMRIIATMSTTRMTVLNALAASTSLFSFAVAAASMTKSCKSFILADTISSLGSVSSSR